jgi:hypothetical protein
MKKTVILTVLGFCLSATAALAFEKEDLNGKWEGTSPLGDSLELTLKVNGDEITGTGHTPPKGKHAGSSPSIEGKIKGNNVVLTTSNYSHERQSKVTYHCSWDEAKLLNCHVKAKNFDTQFRKLD